MSLGRTSCLHRLSTKLPWHCFVAKSNLNVILVYQFQIETLHSLMFFKVLLTSAKIIYTGLVIQFKHWGGLL